MIERGIAAWIWDQLDEASLGSASFWIALAGILTGIVGLLTLELTSGRTVLLSTALAAWVLVFIRGWRHALRDYPGDLYEALHCYRASCIVTLFLCAMMRYQ